MGTNLFALVSMANRNNRNATEINREGLRKSGLGFKLGYALGKLMQVYVIKKNKKKLFVCLGVFLSAV